MNYLKPPVNAITATTITSEPLEIVNGMARLRCNPASPANMTVSGYTIVTSGTPTGTQCKIVTYAATGGTVNLPLLQFASGLNATTTVTYDGVGTSVTAELFADMVAFLTPLSVASTASLPAATTDLYTRGRAGDTAIVGGTGWYVSSGTAWEQVSGGGSSDTIPPTVTAFTVGTESNMVVQVTAFSATDDNAVVGYLITESNTRPTESTVGWLSAVPTTYQGSSLGTKTLYPWAMDGSGNVSLAFANPRTVTFTSTDVTAPTVTAFTVGTATMLTVPINSFTATDAVGVTGYKITESGTAPAFDAAGWETTAPTSYTAASTGNHTLYPWAKDLAGNVSSVFGSPRTVNFPGDVTGPTVSTFTVGSPVDFTVPVTAFTATDDVAVTAYLITESNTQPASGAAGWSGTAPTSYTTANMGSVTLYPWAKDAAGNVSSVFGSPRTVTFPTYPYSMTDGTVMSNGWTAKISGTPASITRSASTTFAITTKSGVGGAKTSATSAAGCLVTTHAASGYTVSVDALCNSALYYSDLNYTDAPMIIIAGSTAVFPVTSGTGTGITRRKVGVATTHSNSTNFTYVDIYYFASNGDYYLWNGSTFVLNGSSHVSFSGTTLKPTVVRNSDNSYTITIKDASNNTVTTCTTPSNILAATESDVIAIGDYIYNAGTNTSYFANQDITYSNLSLVSA